MGTVLAVVFGLIVGAFALLPLVSYFRQIVRPRPRFVPLDLSRLPLVQFDHLQSTIHSLSAEGFLPETYLRVADGHTRNHVDFVLLANRVERSIALITMRTQQPAEGKLPTRGDIEVTYQTRFTNGAVLETNNGQRMSYTPTLVNEIRNFLPTIRDLHRLHQLHCFAIEENNLHIREGKTIYDEGQAEQFLIHCMEEAGQAQIDQGYLRKDKRGLETVIRPTIKGAYLFTWNNMFPVNVVRWVVRMIREREVLNGFRLSPWGLALTR